MDLIFLSALVCAIQHTTELVPSQGKRGGLASGRASGHKVVGPKPPCMKKSWDECVRQDLKSLGLKESGHWRERVGGA